MTATNEFTHLMAILALIFIVSILLALFFLTFDAPKVLTEAAFTVGMVSFASLIFITTIATSMASDDLSTYPHYDKVKTIYANDIGANVTYIGDNKIYTGGTSAQNRTKNETDETHTLKLTKGETDVTKKVKYHDIIGDRNGIVDKIEYGTRTWTRSVFGYRIAEHKEPIVKVYLTSKDPKTKKELEKLLDEE